MELPAGYTDLKTWTITVGGTSDTNIKVLARAVLRQNGISTLSTDGGTVTPQTQGVATGSNASITAVAKSGYSFLGWAETQTATTYLSTAETFTPTVNEEKTYYAIFTQQ